MLLQRNTYFPIAMEDFPANDNTIDMLYDYLLQTDVYVLLIGDDIGSVIGSEASLKLERIIQRNHDVGGRLQDLCRNLHKNVEELTFTQLEYVFAQALQLHTLVFVKYENDERLFENRIKKFFGEPKLHTFGKWSDTGTLKNGIIAALDTIHYDEKPLWGWVKKSESPLYTKCLQMGIADFESNGKNFNAKFEACLKETRVLKILTTTGQGLVHSNVKLLAEFIANGGELQFAAGIPNTDFLNDVMRAEKNKLGSRRDIHVEFEDVMRDFASIYTQASRINHERNSQNHLGVIKVAGVRSLFRSTILMCEKFDGTYWGWVSITLPPEKSVDTITFELATQHSSCVRGNGKNKMIDSVVNHFKHVWNLAEEDRMLLTIDDSNIDDNGELDITAVKQIMMPRVYWQARWQEAVANMKEREDEEKILIEVAAQHPLKGGSKPNEEFKARLDVAIKLYKQKREEGYEVMIFVPGSVHTGRKGKPDECSLSAAGKRYLMEKGIDESVILGDEINEREYEGRPWNGVYNSADECYVAAQCYNTDDSYHSLYSVCSPNQVPRKTFFYVQHGIIPLICSVPTSNMFHDFLGEIFDTIPNIISYDHDWQSPDSKEAIRTRKERMPGFNTVKDK